MYILEFLQKLFVLANALQAVVFSDELGRAVDSIRRNAMCSVGSRGAIAVARDLTSYRNDLEESVKSILGNSYHELQQMNLSCTDLDRRKKQVSEETLMKVKAYILSETKEYCLEVKKNLVMNHVLFDEECKGGVPDYEEIASDKQASEVLEAVSFFIATLNITCSLAEHIKEVLDEVKVFDIAGVKDQEYLKYLKCAMRARNSSFDCLARLWKTSKYEFNSKAILFSKEYFRDFNLPDALYHGDECKSDSRFVVLPETIKFRTKDGELIELVS